MVSMDGGFVFSLLFLFVVGGLLWLVGARKSASLGAVSFGTSFLCLGSLGLGLFIATGQALYVNGPSSTADLRVGHYYETLVQVPDVEVKNPLDGVNRKFVIKDGESPQVLMIRINQETLPPRFTLDHKGKIIALPASAPEAPAPAPSK
jgi:hypothetical protein